MEQQNTHNLAKINRTLEALRKNNINALYAESPAAAATMVKNLVPIGASISCGGSMSLAESGILDLMKSGDYAFLDRSLAKTPEEVQEIYHEANSCHTFFMSANAMTEDGELYNVDGNGNRVSALTHGPQQVIVIVGENKIVRDLTAAIYRVKTIAAPRNGQRLGTDTPCARTGICVGVNGKMTDGCRAPGRMCAQYVITGYQRNPQRITVILLNQSLGY